MFPGFDSFYWVEEPAATRAYRGSLRDDPPGIDYFRLARGTASTERPIRVSHYGGKTPGDFIWTDYPAVCLISARLKEALESKALKGWCTYPVQLFSRTREEMNGFFGLAITGRCGMLDWQRSLPVLKDYPGGMSTDYRGICFPEDSWDGSDLFMPRETAWIFASERFGALAKSLRVKNAKLRRLGTAEVSGLVVRHLRSNQGKAG